MIKTKFFLKNVIYIIVILALIFIYKIHEKNVITKQNSFDIFMINIALNNKDEKTVNFKIKNLDEKNSNLIIKNNKLNVKKNKKNLNNKKIKNKINILKF
ncbi:hypothetical protein [Candidatus Azoamicus ciliaticola]|uniref:Uncharacterized protein n=1 Tax=Candidatus Azoamicus ciliaticola TaxID=2652803 RepID=A0A6J5JZ37_9GAMM|nr:hypothetical protein [Candidatus Azoamicus ciliaticola]CAB3976307.1 Uncharacterised protein [Candidatus Azoamicus ciliaticola]